MKAPSFHLVSESPAPLYMGGLPTRWDDVPARVVVNLCGVMPYGDGLFGRVALIMPLLDLPEPELMPSREQLEAFLEAAHAHAAREATYWHCHAGLNRSGLAVAAYLHRYRGLRISEVIRSLRVTRSPMVLSNHVFEQKLREWYGEADEQVLEPLLGLEL